MEGQTKCVLCEFRSRSTSSLKQHMENKHNVFNSASSHATSSRVDDLESKMKETEHLVKKVEDNLKETKEALKKILEEKKKALDRLITSQK